MTRRIDIWVESAGLGHVTRQISLFEHLRERVPHAKPRFIIDGRIATREAVERAGHDFTVRDPEISQAFLGLQQEWSVNTPLLFILDSVFHDQSSGADAVLRSVPSVVFIDDPADRDVACDLLVNALPDLDAPSEKRQAKRAVRGVDYLVLPTEYMAVRSAALSRGHDECTKGFAFFGGADLENFAQVFVQGVASRPAQISWRLLLGPAYAHASRLTEVVSSLELPIELVRYVPSMAAELLHADIAILAAGNTLSECAAVGTPALVFAQNPVQGKNAHFFASRSDVVDLGGLSPESSGKLHASLTSLARDSARRTSMSQKMMSTVDAEGGRRVAEIIASLMERQR